MSLAFSTNTRAAAPLLHLASHFDSLGHPQADTLHLSAVGDRLACRLTDTRVYASLDVYTGTIRSRGSAALSARALTKAILHQADLNTDPLRFTCNDRRKTISLSGGVFTRQVPHHQTPDDNLPPRAATPPTVLATFPTHDLQGALAHLLAVMPPEGPKVQHDQVAFTPLADHVLAAAGSDTAALRLRLKASAIAAEGQQSLPPRAAAWLAVPPEYKCANTCLTRHYDESGASWLSLLSGAFSVSARQNYFPYPSFAFFANGYDPQDPALDTVLEPLDLSVRLKAFTDDVPVVLSFLNDTLSIEQRNGDETTTAHLPLGASGPRTSVVLRLRTASLRTLVSALTSHPQIRLVAESSTRPLVFQEAGTDFRIAALAPRREQS